MRVVYKILSEKVILIGRTIGISEVLSTLVYTLFLDNDKNLMIFGKKEKLEKFFEDFFLNFFDA